MIRLVEPIQHAFTIGMAMFCASTLHLAKGDWAQARSRIERWVAVARAGNSHLHLPWAIASSAWPLAQLGEASDALTRIREGELLLERHAANGLRASIASFYCLLGRASLRLGRCDEARRLGNRALEFCLSSPGYAAHALHLLGDVATQSDPFDAERGEAHYRKALALAKRLGMRPLVAHCHLGLGKISLRTSQPDQARDHLAVAAATYRDTGMTYWLEQVEPEMSGPQASPRNVRKTKTTQ
jgi:tetratricopeptide (TPR) repeat protein